MKRLLIPMVCFFMLVPAISYGDLALNTPIVRQDYDTFRLARFQVHLYQDNAPIHWVELRVYLGYEVEGAFVLGEARRIAITNSTIHYHRGILHRDDGDGLMLALPTAYQLNPATKILTEINGGTFGGAASLQAYLEAIIRTLAGI